MENVKQPKSFRLSSQAVERLGRLEDLTGSNQTAIIEMSLAILEAMTLMREGKDANIDIPVDADFMLTALEMGINLFPEEFPQGQEVTRKQKGG